MKRGDAADDGRKRGRYLRVGDVGHVHLAVDVEMVDLRLEGAADLADVAAEFDARATGLTVMLVKPREVSQSVTAAMSESAGPNCAPNC